MSNKRNKNIIETLENVEFQQIQKDINMFIKNQDSKLVEEAEKGDLEYINSKVKKVRFQDKEWVRIEEVQREEEDNIVNFCRESINSNKKKVQQYKKA